MFAGLAAGLTAFAVQAQAQSQSQSQSQAPCSVSNLRGFALVLRQGTSMRLGRGAGIWPDDQLVTGNKTRLRVACTGRAEITVGPESSVSMQDLANMQNQSNMVLELLQGILRVAISANADRRGFQIRTPTAVAAARSTEWITEAQPALTGVLVLKGSVAVSNRRTGNSVTVDAGLGTNVAADADPTPPAPWGRPRAESALSRTSFQ
ncbi:MAG TPA: FecR domain-containing protein [Ferrovibrio sp.]|uniref:FecR domain-containing protein n=1 Tax=Ferrovibrio sp. TaxID=1917215 RepID=UPI002ED55EE5